MENEKILAKIKKLFELSGNNPSEEEAKSAALKAQQLMVEYGIEYAEVQATDVSKTEPIGTVECEVPAKKWKYELARLVANNFRCKHFLRGKDVIVFFGHKTDALIAAETFDYLFERVKSFNSKLLTLNY